jgi:hypothetical protein
MGDYSTYSFLGRKSSREVLVNCLRVLRNALKIKVNRNTMMAHLRTGSP